MQRWPGPSRPRSPMGAKALTSPGTWCTQAGTGEAEPCGPHLLLPGPLSAPKVLVKSPITTQSPSQLCPPFRQRNVRSEVQTYPFSSLVFKKEIAVGKEARSPRPWRDRGFFRRDRPNAPALSGFPSRRCWPGLPGEGRGSPDVGATQHCPLGPGTYQRSHWGAQLGAGRGTKASPHQACVSVPGELGGSQ